MTDNLILTSLVGIITSLVGAYIAIKTYTSKQTSDLVDKVRKDTETNMKLDFISQKLLESSNDMKIHFDRIEERLENHEIRITKLEQKER